MNQYHRSDAHIRDETIKIRGQEDSDSSPTFSKEYICYVQQRIDLIYNKAQGNNARREFIPIYSHILLSQVLKVIVRFSNVYTRQPPFQPHANNTPSLGSLRKRW